ncbi:uncharacterized protein LOC131878384 [Tigriopus californicus]|uniref:uncharacterized protein LOC131878384 n=1 Tax=Tigriopus californicus TaxID=6832 RepID=UPI0027DAA0F3|nr:uncharacterized protein LOC131878384 [Tigriopus californicus]
MGANIDIGKLPKINTLIHFAPISNPGQSTFCNWENGLYNLVGLSIMNILKFKETSVTNEHWNDSVLGVSQKTMELFLPMAEWDSLRSIGSMRSISDKFFYIMPIIIGVPQLLLNLYVFISVILVTCQRPGCSRNRPSKRNGGKIPTHISSSHKAAFIFIANLAAADMLMVVVELCVAYLQFTTHYGKGYQGILELNLDDISHEFAQSRRIACNWQVGLWMFAIAHTLACSLLITVDRYIYITRGLRYNVIMTPARIKCLLMLSWGFPSIWTCVSVLLFNQQRDAECVVGHILPTFHTAAVLGTLMLFLVIIYVLYGLILFKFFRRKRALKQLQGHETVAPLQSNSTRVRILFRSKTHHEFSDVPCTMIGFARHGSGELNLHSHSLDNFNTIQHPSSAKLGILAANKVRSTTLIRALSSLSKFTKAAKYVLILVLVFTLAWLPWIIIMYVDLVLHGTGKWETFLEDIECSEQLDLSPDQLMRLQICIFHAFSNPKKLCYINTKDTLFHVPPKHLCRPIMEAIHAQNQDSWQKIALVIGATNSLLNPIIYAFWYAEFRLRIRKAWRDLWSRIVCQSKDHY